MKMLILAVSLGSVAGLSGCRHGRSPEERVQYMAEKLSDKLDFNAEQKALLAEITKELQADWAQEKQRRDAVRAEAEKMILSDSLDTARVKELIKERQSRMDSKIDKYLEKVAALHKTMNPEQKKELVELINKFHRH